MATTATAMTTMDVHQAAVELAKMKRSLKSWLKYRQLGDAILAGTAPSLKKPLAYAQNIILSYRTNVAAVTDQDLANKLYALLSEVMPDAQLPSADLTANPTATSDLAQIAITGQAPLASTVATPTATSGVGVTHPWLWPVLIVGGLLLAVTTAIKSAADVASQSEHDACIEAGACTDYGMWLKAGGIVMLAWFAWTQLGVRDLVKRRAS